MNNLLPDYLTPYVLIGTVAVVGAVLFGLQSAVTRARLPVRDRRLAVWSGGALLVA